MGSMLPLSAMSTVMVMLAAAAAAPAAHAQEPAGRCQTTRAAVVRSAQQLCGDAPVADSLRSVGLLDGQHEDDGTAAAGLPLLLEAWRKEPRRRHHFTVLLPTAILG